MHHISDFSATFHLCTSSAQVSRKRNWAALVASERKRLCFAIGTWNERYRASLQTVGLWIILTHRFFTKSLASRIRFATRFATAEVRKVKTNNAPVPLSWHRLLFSRETKKNDANCRGDMGRSGAMIWLPIPQERTTPHQFWLNTPCPTVIKRVIVIGLMLCFD